MVRAASKCVMVADSSKLGRIELVPICGIADIDLLITGQPADAGHVMALREQGVRVELAADPGYVRPASSANAPPIRWCPCRCEEPSGSGLRRCRRCCYCRD
jgi:hypothetical protein